MAMSGSTRIKGVALALKLGSPAVDYWCDVTAATITNDEGDTDVITFCDAAEGNDRQYFLNLTAIQSTDADGLWRYTWDHSGEVVGFTYAPHGNETPTVSQPHFIGTVKIGPRPTIGGEAGQSNTYTFDTVWEIEGVPVLDDGTGS
jgi:YD repeat-containing protein